MIYYAFKPDRSLRVDFLPETTKCHGGLHKQQLTVENMKKLTKEEFVNVFPIFRTNNDGLTNEILSAAVYKKFAKDAFLYLEGDSCSGIAFVLAGEIRVFKTSESGREITLYEIFPGETCILNASCILSHRKYPANAVGISDGTMIYLPHNIFQKLIASSEEMRMFIFTLFSRRFAEIIELVEEITFGKMDQRLTDYLAKKAENDRLYTTHQKIADELGTSREVVSRLLKDFERKEKIFLARNLIRILNI